MRYLFFLVLILIPIVTSYPKLNIQKPIVYISVPKKVKKLRVKSDLNLLASVINSEAAGEPYEEKLRIGNVVINRVNSKYYPNSIREVIYQNKQFSGINSYLFRYKPNGNWGDKQSIKAAKELLSGKKVLDKNIIGFFNPEISTDTSFVRKIMDKVIFSSDKHFYFEI